MKSLRATDGLRSREREASDRAQRVPILLDHEARDLDSSLAVLKRDNACVDEPTHRTLVPRGIGTVRVTIAAVENVSGRHEMA